MTSRLLLGFVSVLFGTSLLIGGFVGTFVALIEGNTNIDASLQAGLGILLLTSARNLGREHK